MKKFKIGIIGLGYVGLPLAVEFSKKFKVIGYDINESRVNELNNNIDNTLEISSSVLEQVNVKSIDNLSKRDFGLFSTTKLKDLELCNFYIITVPTPVDKNKNPVLTPLIKASNSVGSILKKGDFVVYESTVYPGATEDDCLPILEEVSSLEVNKDFYLGYSPERINPGDKNHTVTKIKKVTSGSNDFAASEIDKLYKEIIIAGTFKAKSIKVAEAAKVIENSQRDINIAFVNELSKIFNLMNIDTNDVLDAASTKWNFLNFKPGLVGGHCIGVDPYYLAQKAKEFGYNPEIILSGRRINDSMGKFISDQFIKELINSDKLIKKSKVLIMGVTFKENCPDIRNTGVIGIIKSLNNFSISTTIFDPWANPDEVKSEYDLDCTNSLPNDKFDGIIIAVAHNEFKKIDIEKLKNSKNSVVYDVKGITNNYTLRL